jgi:hypothetical protein
MPSLQFIFLSGSLRHQALHPPESTFERPQTSSVAAARGRSSYGSASWGTGADDGQDRHAAAVVDHVKVCFARLSRMSLIAFL